MKLSKPQFQSDYPCLSAFQEWMDERRIVAKMNNDWSNGLFENPRAEALWEGFICAWGICQPKPAKERALREAISNAIRGNRTPSTLINAIFDAIRAHVLLADESRPKRNCQSEDTHAPAKPE
jgi:hypothetical protein